MEKENYNIENAKNKANKKSIKNSTIPTLENTENDELNKEKETIKPALAKKIKSFLAIDDEKETNGIEDGKTTKFLFSYWIVIEKCAMIISLIGILLSVLQYDIEYTDPTSKITKNLLWMIFMTTIILIPFTIYRYQVKIKLLKAQNNLSQKATLLSSDEFVPMLIELLMILPAPLPFLQGEVFKSYNYHEEKYIFYRVNDILSLTCLIRLVLILRILLMQTNYANYQSMRICKMYGCNATYMFAIKCLMKNVPIRLVFISLIASIFIFGHALRICERPLEDLEGNYMNFGYYWNSIWCIILTMTTVGYGDYYPRSLPGRILIFIVCIWGVFLVSMMVVTLTNTLNLDNLEAKSLNIIMRVEKRKEEKAEAAYILTLAAKYRFIFRKYQNNPTKCAEKISELKSKIKKHMNKFKIANRQLREMYDGISLSEELNMNFDFLKNDLNDLADQQKKLAALNEEIAAKLIKK